MQGYVRLQRRFAEYAAAVDRDSLGFFYSSELFAPYTWEKIRGHRCTVIVGASGTGKSVEFKEQTGALREEGKVAFFCRLEDLASLPLASTLQVGTAPELTAWFAGADEGWFFLDAIDEAKLINPRQFEWAISKFVDAIASHVSRVHIVISTRPHAWEAYGDLDMLCHKLGLRALQPGERDDEAQPDDETDDDDTVDRAGGSSEEAKANPAPAKQEKLHVLSLMPLGPSDVRTFAGALGVEDVAPFMEKVESANADVFANRPADLPGLIDLWRTTKGIGSYSNVILQNITIKLKELNPRHQQAAILTPERALIGAERLAAAATLSRRSSLLLPDRSPLDSKVRDELLDPKDVPLDWRPAEVQELLGRGLFDESLYGSVRFHHRTAREYLAARWLRRLLGQRKHRRSIKRLLFARPYGTEKPVIVPSLKPVVGWLALWDQDIRDTVLRIDPKLLLEFGDASRLPTEVRAGMLRNFAARYATQKYTPLSLDLRELRRLADDQLLPSITQLLGQYREHDDVRHLLLRLMRVGKIRNSAPVALSYAIDDTMDRYSRVTAVQTIGVVGSTNDKTQLRAALFAGPLSERDLLGAAIKTLYGTHLQLAELPDLLRTVPQGGESSYDSLQQELISIIESLPDEEHLIEFLSTLVVLLTQPPLTEEWCRISREFAWLIPSAMAAAKKLLANRPDGPFYPAVVTTVFMGDQADNLRFYTGDVHKEAEVLLSTNRALRHAVFWHAAEQRRLARPAERLTAAWAVTMSQHVLPSEPADAPLFLAALRERAREDDQQIALSAVLNIHSRSGSPVELMTLIEEGVRGVQHLEAALDAHLNPPPPTPERVAAQQQFRQMEEERLVEQERRKQERDEGITFLKANVATLAIGDHARGGRILRNIRYLHGEIVNLSKRSGSRWAITRWRVLERDFGPEVAKAFRDYCVAYWRLYQPQLRSEIGEDAQSTPWAVILGLSGLGIEAAEDPTWATKLAPDEAVIATRYALWELNSLPIWFEALFDGHPTSVTQVLLGEMTWELAQPRTVNSAGYIFARLRWTSTRLGTALRDDILGLLSANPAADATALTEALTVILRNPAELPTDFSDMLAERVGTARNDDVKALWLAGLLCINADQALPSLEAWVAGGADAPARETRISKVLEHVWGDSFHGFSPEHQTFRRADLLVRLIKLSHIHVNPALDVEHREVHTPGLRDHAQEARDRLVKILREIPGPDTYHALLELSDFHAEAYPKDRMLVLAEGRAEADTEHDAWAPEDIDAFAADAEKGPRTQKDLFELALSRLDDLKLDLEEGDESEASLLRRVGGEVELRRVIANRLRFSAAGKYTTGSEEELADTTRTDIRLHHPEVEARIPIELKIADAQHWRASALREKLKEQLSEQYLREAQYGIFLLVRRGGPTDRRSWPHRGLGKTFDFPKLVTWLQDEAHKLVRADPSIDGLEVISIDLTLRH